MEQATCKNCNAVLIDAYCHKCGQKAGTSRITLKSLWHEVVHSLTHIEKGFFYTSIGLFISPGKIINGYLDGKRVKHHRPFGLYFLWIAIYILIDGITKREVSFEPLSDLSRDSILYEPLKAVYPLYEHYLTFITLPLFLIISVLLYFLVTRWWKYNFAETIIIYLYISTAAYIVAIFIQILAAITGTYGKVQTNQINIIIPYLYIAWAIFDILKRKNYFKAILVSLTFTLIAIITFYCYLRFGVPFVVSFFM